MKTMDTLDINTKKELYLTRAIALLMSTFIIFSGAYNIKKVSNSKKLNSYVVGEHRESQNA